MTCFSHGRARYQATDRAGGRVKSGGFLEGGSGVAVGRRSLNSILVRSVFFYIKQAHIFLFTNIHKCSYLSITTYTKAYARIVALEMSALGAMLHSTAIGPRNHRTRGKKGTRKRKETAKETQSSTESAQTINNKNTRLPPEKLASKENLPSGLGLACSRIGTSHMGSAHIRHSATPAHLRQATPRRRLLGGLSKGLQPIASIFPLLSIVQMHTYIHVCRCIYAADKELSSRST
jgi:hypothetical protein